MKRYYLVGRLGTYEPLTEIPETTSLLNIQVENTPSPSKDHAIKRIKDLCEAFPDQSFTYLEVFSNREIEHTPKGEEGTQKQSPQGNDEDFEPEATVNYQSLLNVCMETIQNSTLKYPHDYRAAPQFLAETVQGYFDGWTDKIQGIGASHGINLSKETIKNFLLTGIIEILEKRLQIQLTTYAEARTRFHADLAKAQQGNADVDIAALRYQNLQALLKAKSALAFSSYGDKENTDWVVEAIHTTAIAVVSGHDFSNYKQKENNNESKT